MRNHSPESVLDTLPFLCNGLGLFPVFLIFGGFAVGFFSFHRVLYRGLINNTHFFKKQNMRNIIFIFSVTKKREILGVAKIQTS